MIQIMAVVTGCVINVNSNGIYWNNETISCSYLIFAWLQTEKNFNQKDIKKTVKLFKNVIIEKELKLKPTSFK